MEQGGFHHNAHIKSDTVAVTLQAIAQWLLIGTIGVLPLFFIPAVAINVGAAKVFALLVGLAVVVIFYSLAVLRAGEVTTSFPLVLAALWGVGGVTVGSALISGDVRDALVGTVFETQTAGFVALLAVLATLTTYLLADQAAVMRLYLVLTLSTIILSLYHLVRVVWGPEVLSFGLFAGAATSPVGTWNDVALFFGFVVLIALVAIEQLPLTKWGRLGAVVLVGLSLVMLMVINFFALWIVLGLSGLTLLVYGLTKDRFKTPGLTPAGSSLSMASIGVSLAVFAVSVCFVVGGTFFGSLVSSVTGISYVEVRPSFSATLDIGRAVYTDNAFTGIGPNRFVDAWRLHKEQAINETIFWNTDFQAGHGFVTTQFVTIGILGMIAWGAFFTLLVYTGLRMLFATMSGDRLWYYIGTSSFVTAVYLWGMFMVYVPGPVLLALAAVSTGLVGVASVKLRNVQPRTLLLTDRRSGFGLIAVSMLLMIAAIGSLYVGGRYFYAQYLYGTALTTISDGQTLEATEATIADAFRYARNDIYPGQLALYQLSRLNTLLALAEPTPEQQQQFQNAIANGIAAAEEAIALDPTEARYHAVLGSIYSVLATVNIDGAAERAAATLATARSLDPQNPEYALLEAQYLSRQGELDQAREKVTEAISLKRNYTDAYFFLSQLDIAAGNTAAAIAATEATIALEPQNPARRYQLGVLLASNQDAAGAIAAFEEAIRLDPSYANARYFLALAYSEAGRVDDAIRELEIVATLNADNASVASLINQLRTNGSVTATPRTVAEPVATEDDAAVVTPTTVPDSDLLSPVNTPPAAPDEAASEPARDDNVPAATSTAE